MEFIRLKYIREDNDLSQKDIAKLLNCKQQQYYRYEKGIYTIPLEYIIILADFYNTSIDYLVGRTNKK